MTNSERKRPARSGPSCQTVRQQLFHSTLPRPSFPHLLFNIDHFVPECIDRGQVTPCAVHVHSESEHIPVGNGDSDEVRDDGFRTSEVLICEHGAIKLGGTRVEELLPYRCERVTFVQNVVDDEYDAAGDSGAWTHLPGYLPTDGGRAVARHVEIVEMKRKTQLRQQVTGEHYAAAHHAQH